MSSNEFSKDVTGKNITEFIELREQLLKEDWMDNSYGGHNPVQYQLYEVTQALKTYLESENEGEVEKLTNSRIKSFIHLVRNSIFKSAA
ncbi:MAG: hypothetical protein ABL927_07745 [Bdellovibrionales bacterium]